MSDNAVTTTRQLPVPLDTYRKQALQNQMVESRMEEMRISDHMKHVNESLKSQIKDHQKAQNDAARALSAGFEYQQVACEDTPDLDRNRMVTTRIDTSAVVTERALTADEIRHFTKKKTTVKP